MSREEKEQWLYETYQYTRNFDFNRLDRYKEANDDICIDDLILNYTMLYEFHKEEIERLNKRIEDLNTINEEHRVLNGKLREELEFEKATNKELLSTGADLENKLYEEQDKNKRLNNIINELEKWLEEDLKQVYRDAGHRHNLILEVLDKLQELKGSDKE